MDLATRYLGLALANPLIASSSPLTGALDSLRRLEDSGAAAVVLPSIFEEQIAAETAERERLARLTEGFPEASSFFPAGSVPEAGPHEQLALIARARAALAIPVIASLNGATESGWIEYARLVEQAGAQAIEINVYFPPIEPTLDGTAVERRHLAVLEALKRTVSVPVAMKLTPAFSAPGAVIRALDAAGADGFVLFNRLYQPDINLAALRPSRQAILSSRSEIGPGLLWIGALAGRLRGSLAAGTGVETAEEVIKYLLVGADTVMSTAALLRHGPAYLRTLLEGLERWGEARGFASVESLRGCMSQAAVGRAMRMERGDYIEILQGFTAILPGAQGGE